MFNEKDTVVELKTKNRYEITRIYDNNKMIELTRTITPSVDSQVYIEYEDLDYEVGVGNYQHFPYLGEVNKTLLRLRNPKTREFSEYQVLFVAYIESNEHLKYKQCANFYGGEDLVIKKELDKLIEKASRDIESKDDIVDLRRIAKNKAHNYIENRRKQREPRYVFKGEKGYLVINKTLMTKHNPHLL